MTLRLSVIMPVFNGAAYLDRSLSALKAGTRPPDEIIVIDNGSTDSSAALAHAQGAIVLTTPNGQRGPAQARNFGAAAATGDVLVFIDADVVVHPAALARIEQTLIDQPGIDGVFGSYDDKPPAPGLASRYKNLLHHYVHQHGHQEALTFWTGCGAVRKTAFEAVGGFDERYTRPSIEDIDLGARLRRAGRRVWLHADVQATHLKRWTLRNLLRSDVHDRAVPWTRLILREGYLPGDLNLDLRSRFSAGLAWLLVLSLLLSVGTAWALPIGLLAIAGLLSLNADLYRFFARHGDPGFMLGAMGLHNLYLLYGSFVFGLLSMLHFLTHPPARRRAFIALLIVTFLKGWLWSVIVPPWQASDEDQHFGYAQEVARQQTWPVSPPATVPIERVRLWELVDVLRVSGQREPIDLSPVGRAQLDRLLRQLDEPAARTTPAEPVWFPGFVRQHPPLYYTLQAMVHQLAADQSILTRLAWMRLLSVLMGLGTIVCAYGAARTLWPDRAELALAVAALISFQPSFTFFTSVVNNVALEMLSFALLTWLLIVISRNGLTTKCAGLLGVTLTIGLLSKSSFLAALPLIGLLAIWDTRRQRRRVNWRAWLIAIVIPIVLAGWWYAAFLFSGGGEVIDVYKPVPPPAVSVPLIDYVLHYPWLTRYGPFTREWWAGFGWRDTFLPAPIYSVLDGTVLIAVIGGVWAIMQRRRADVVAWLLGGAATLSLIVFYTALDYRLALVGGAFKIQGRYFLAPIAAQFLALTAGWAAIRRGRTIVLVLIIGTIGLNVYALFGVIAPRYYGEELSAQRAPTEDSVALDDAGLSRALDLDEVPARVDVWLKATGTASSAELTLLADGREVMKWPIEPWQMTLPYPTVLRGSASDVGGAHHYTLMLRGAHVDATLADDGQLAAKVYRAIPIGQWPDRLALIQPAADPPVMMIGLIGLYALSTIGLIAALVKAWAAR
jgi:glycosyltransferase involved in cell wall biosynthesis/4-amino-4-deoxy-L-arabinose transferase-like glycosyltransferase